MKKLKNVVVGAVLCTAFGMNLNYAAKGYGTAFADVAGTTAPINTNVGQMTLATKSCVILERPQTWLTSHVLITRNLFSQRLNYLRE